MQGQYLRYADTNPSVELFFFDNNGAPITTLTHSTANLALSYVRDNGASTAISLVTQTATGAWTAGGFVHVAGGCYRLDLPTAATTTGAARLTIISTGSLANTFMNPFVVALGTDDLTAASLTAANVRDELLSLREGAQTEPAGGSTQVLSIVDQPGGTTLGVVRVYRDSAGRVVGRTEMTPT